MEAVTEKEERGAESVQRWTAKRRSALVPSILRGETSAQEAARKHGLTVAKIEGWQERYLLAPENALRSRPRNEEALKDEVRAPVPEHRRELARTAAAAAELHPYYREMYLRAAAREVGMQRWAGPMTP